MWVILSTVLWVFATFLNMIEDDPVNNYKAYRPLWPAKLLRVTMRVYSTAFFVPSMMCLFAALNCTSGSAWANTGLTCFSPAHNFFIALAVACLPCAFVTAVGAAALLIDRREDAKRNLLSQSHGRVAVVMILIKTVLSVVFSFAVTPSVSPLLVNLAALVGGLAWLIAYARFLPYHQQWLNELQCAIAGIFLSAVVAAFLSEGTPNPESSVGTWAFLFTAPLAAFMGWAIAVMSRATFNGRRELSSPYAVETKARAMLAEIRAEENQGGSGGHFGGRVTGVKGEGVAAGETHATHSTNLVISDILSRKRDVQLMFEDGLGVFSGSAILELFISHFLATVMHNRHLENVHLRAALAKSDTSALDIRFFVWEANDRVMRDEAASNTVRTSVLRRMQFDTLQIESDRLCMRGRMLSLDFWSECCEKRPDMVRMQNIGIDVIATIRRCDNVYKQLLELSPQSAAVMRAYAEFLLELANDPRKALDLLQLAETIEEEESRAHGSDNDAVDYPLMVQQPDFDLSHESVSLLRIDGSASKVGMILDVNNAALKLFGFTRREIVSKNIASLVPEPLSAVHDRFLLRYIQTGEEHIVNTSRIYYGVHKAGYVFPMCANIRPMEDGFGAVFEGITTSQAFIIFMGSPARWKVTAICKTTLALLNLSLDDVRAGQVSMDVLVPSLLEGLVQEEGGESPQTTHSPLMNDMINANETSGPGVDVVFNILDWRTALAAQSKVQRRASMMAASSGRSVPVVQSNADLHLTSPRLTSPWASRHSKQNALPDGAAEELAEAFKPIRGVMGVAKLQELQLAYIPSPMYVLRWRVAQAEVYSSSSSGPGGGEIQDDEGSDADSNAVQGSEGEEEEPKRAHKVVLDHLPVGIRAGSQLDVPLPASDAVHAAAAQLTAAVSLQSPRSALKGGNQRATPAPAIKERAATPLGSARGSKPPDTAVKGPSMNAVKGPAAAAASKMRVPALTLPGAVDDAGVQEEEAADVKVLAPPAVAAPEDASEAAHGIVSQALVSSSADLESTLSKTLERTASKSITWDNPPHFSRAKSSREGSQLTDTPPSGGVLALRRVVSPVGGVLRLESPEMESGGEGGGFDKPKAQKARSAVSGSSGGSSHATDALRKGITLRSREMEGSLVALRRALVLVFIVVAAVNSVSTIITTQLFVALVTATNFVEENGGRGVSLQRAYSQIQRLRFWADGLLEMTPAEVDITHSRLHNDLEDLDELHRSLYLKSTLMPGSPAATFWSVPSVLVNDLDTDVNGNGLWYSPSNYSDTNRTINVGDAGLEFIIKARFLRSANKSALTMANPNVYWTLTNGPVTLRSAFNQSMIIAQEATETQASTVYLVNVIVLGVALSLMAVMVIGVMLPAVRKVLVQKTSVFNIFLSTPLTTLRRLRASTEFKINSLRKAEEEAEAGNDIAGAADTEIDEELHQSDGEMSSIGGGDSVTKDNQSHGSHSTGAVAVVPSASAKGHKRARARRFRMTSAFDIRSFYFLLPILLLVGYYGATYTWKQSVVLSSQYYKSEIFFSNQVSFMIGQSSFNMRNIVAQCDVAHVTTQIKRFVVLMATMATLQDGLMYGDATRQIRPLLSVNEDYFKLMMKNGCLSTSEASSMYSYADCVSPSGFYGGLVGRGLQAAIKEYAGGVGRIVKLRADAVASGSCTPGSLSVGLAGQLQTLEDFYLSTGLSYAASLTVQSTRDSLNLFMSMDVAITCASVLGVLFFYFFIYGASLAVCRTSLSPSH